MINNIARKKCLKTGEIHQGIYALRLRTVFIFCNTRAGNMNNIFFFHNIGTMVVVSKERPDNLFQNAQIKYSNGKLHKTNLMEQQYAGKNYTFLVDFTFGHF